MKYVLVKRKDRPWAIINNQQRHPITSVLDWYAKECDLERDLLSGSPIDLVHYAPTPPDGLWPIWMSGFHIQGGGPTPAHYVGKAKGDTFADAVRNWYEQHPSSTFDAESLTDWACGLYPTEGQARESFG